MTPTYRVYILKNSSGRRYIGLSAEVNHRLTQHNAGVSKWTKKYRPWIIAWTSHPMALGDARRLENMLKRQNGGDGVDTLMREYGS